MLNIVSKEVFNGSHIGVLSASLDSFFGMEPLFALCTFYPLKLSFPEKIICVGSTCKDFPQTKLFTCAAVTCENSPQAIFSAVLGCLMSWGVVHTQHVHPV